MMVEVITFQYHEIRLVTYYLRLDLIWTKTMETDSTMTHVNGRKPLSCVNIVNLLYNHQRVNC